MRRVAAPAAFSAVRRAASGPSMAQSQSRALSLLYSHGSRDLERIETLRGYTSRIWVEDPATLRSVSGRDIHARTAEREGAFFPEPKAGETSVPLTMPRRMHVFNVAQLEARSPDAKARIDAVVESATRADVSSTLPLRRCENADEIDAMIDDAVAQLDGQPPRLGAQRHRSLLSGGEFPRGVGMALEKASGSRNFARKLWITTRQVEQAGLAPLPGEAPLVVVNSAATRAFNGSQLENGDLLTVMPVRFGTFTRLSGPEADELLVVTRQRGWRTGLFIPEWLAERLGLGVIAGERPHRLGTARDSGAGEVLLNASYVAGALDLAIARREIAALPGDELLAELVEWRDRVAAARESTANPGASSSSSSSKKRSSKRKADEPALRMHRRLMTGEPLSGPALAGAIMLSVDTPAELRTPFWLTTDDIAKQNGAEGAGGLAIEGDAQSMQVLPAAPFRSVNRVEEAIATVRSSSVRGSGTLKAFLSAPLYNVDQLAHPERAFAYSRDPSPLLFNADDADADLHA